MKRVLTILILAVLAGLSIAGVWVAYHIYAPRRVPAGQPPLVRLTPENLGELREAFNAAAGTTRVIAMLSPT